MMAFVIKTFKLSSREFKSGEVIEIPVSIFHKLSLRGLVKPFLPDMPDGQKSYLTEELKRLFKEHADNLSKIPISFKQIKKYYPEVYEKLKELSELLDEAFLLLNREAFIKTAREIEQTISNCLSNKHFISENNKPKPIELEIERYCVHCGGNKWLMLKPNSKTSLIKCLSCGHSELYLRGAK